jgi:SAM-dependent methyltransferase
MTPDEIARMRALYDARLERYGYAPETLGWNKPKHRLRYEVLLAYWNLAAAPGTSVLDVGCGFGDLFGYARERSLEIAYHGIDLNPKLVEVARSIYPEAEFSVADPLGEGLARDYDVIVASGAHNFALADHDRYVDQTFELFAKHARRGFAVNFLSDRVGFRRPENAYTNPERALALALRYSRRALLRHDYMPFEFTVFVDRYDAFDEELTIFRGAFAGP